MRRRSSTRSCRCSTPATSWRILHPFPSGFVAADGNIHPLIREALAKGVRIDVGRGAHFSLTTARRVIDAGILPFTLGADLHGYNVRLDDGGRAYRGMFTGEGVDSIVAEDRASPFARPYRAATNRTKQTT